jgi:hypothetical protein
MGWDRDKSVAVETYRHEDGLTLRRGGSGWDLVIWRLPLGTGLIKTIVLCSSVGDEAPTLPAVEQALSVKSVGPVMEGLVTWDVEYSPGEGWSCLTRDGRSYDPGVINDGHGLVVQLRLLDQIRRDWVDATPQLAHDASPWKDEETGAGSPAAAAPPMAEVDGGFRGWGVTSDARAYKWFAGVEWAIISPVGPQWVLHKGGCAYLDVPMHHCGTVQKRINWAESYIGSVLANATSAGVEPQPPGPLPAFIYKDWTISSGKQALWTAPNGDVWVLCPCRENGTPYPKDGWELRCNGVYATLAHEKHDDLQRVDWAIRYVVARMEGAVVFDTHAKPEDAINPGYYSEQGVTECIDVMAAIAWSPTAMVEGHTDVNTTMVSQADHCRVTAFKYLWRAGEKVRPGDTPVDAIERDLGKAIWYLQMALHRLGRGPDPRENT